MILAQLLANRSNGGFRKLHSNKTRSVPENIFHTQRVLLCSYPQMLESGIYLRNTRLALKYYSLYPRSFAARTYCKGIYKRVSFGGSQNEAFGHDLHEME